MELFGSTGRLVSKNASHNNEKVAVGIPDGRGWLVSDDSTLLGRRKMHRLYE